MNAWGQTIIDKLAALNTRERWMVFFAGLAVLYAVLNGLLLSPALRQQQLIQTEMVQTQAQLSDLTQQIATLSQHPVLSANEENTRKIAQLRLNIEAQQSEMTVLQNSLVNPAQMPALLKDLIKHHADLRLVDMKTLPPQNFLGNQTNASTAPDTHAAAPLIYRHALTMTLAGNYMELMRYAQALQTMSAQVLWEKAVLATKAYPENELTITVYTLSLDPTWLSI